jgi:hypothetical protein
MPVGYDAWITASPVETWTDTDINILERNAMPCPFCARRPWIEETARGEWVANCDCGCRLPGDDPFDVAAKWNTRPVVQIRGGERRCHENENVIL